MTLRSPPNASRHRAYVRTATGAPPGRCSSGENRRPISGGPRSASKNSSETNAAPTRRAPSCPGMRADDPRMYAKASKTSLCARQCRHSGEHHSRDEIRQRLGGLHVIEETPQDAGESQRGDNTEAHAYQSQFYRAAHNQTRDLAWFRTQRHANANLSCAPGHNVG